MKVTLYVGAAMRLLGAQSPDRQARGVGDDRAGRHAVEIWGGMSRGSPMWGQLGDMPNQSMTLTAVRFIQRIHRSAGVSVEYGFDFIPVARMSPPYRMPDASCWPACPAAIDSGRGAAAHGAGFNPISLTAVMRTDHAVQFLVGGSGGALWFDQPVPVTTATRFNFTGSVELGTQLIRRDGNGVVLMYRFHHLSNAARGRDNPGVASNVLSIGVRWRLGQELR